MHGINKSGQEVAYARFSMWNHNSTILYNVLDASQYHAGVSGCGERTTFSRREIERAMSAFINLDKNDIPSRSDFLNWDQQQVSDFLENCLKSARKEGSVDVYFG
ncbi:hypothetical protein CR205_11615 [Alteribacter lacisalsi]|uniref:Uncharacterized protein n=1 Tax=Alteribacter lacisalsi TaxID=2045244 RepID=A0A2W0H796_9BACI|nr:hypothetical protein CR205_11615 [Alteribacter lacisalsi]